MRLDNIRAAAQKAGNARAAVKAQEIRTEIIQTLGTPGQGRTYTHYMAMVNGHLVPVRKRDKPHTASAPADAPAVDTGHLRNSIGVQKIGEGAYRVGTDVKYALYLEFGTRRMAARPFMRPALEAVRARGN